MIEQSLIFFEASGPCRRGGGVSAAGSVAEPGGNGEDGEDRGGDPAHELHREALGELVADEDGGRVGDHHAERRARDDPEGLGGELRGERHGGELGLVAHFGEEEEHDGGAEDAEALHAALVRLLVVELVGDEHPGGHGGERDDQDPAEDFGRDEGGEHGAHAARHRVVEDRGDEDAPDDGSRPAESGGEADGHEHGLVADFACGDDAGGEKKSLKGFKHGGLSGTARGAWVQETAGASSSCPMRRPGRVLGVLAVYPEEDTPQVLLMPRRER